MLFDDTYKTVQKSAEGIFRDKGSRFIAYVYPLSSESEIKDIINSLKSLHPKARHYCWALRLSPDRTVFRINDDGEPSGTAGRPILNILLSHELTNVLVIVVRYFGGTLLGVPGLINAYKKATIEALNNAMVIEKTINTLYEVKFDHIQMNHVMRIIKEEDLKIKDQLFDNTCSIKVEIRHSSQDRVLSKLEKIDNLTSKFLGTS